MYKELKLMDYKGNITCFKLPEKEIKFIVIHVVSGDEQACVFYKDGTKEKFDSSCDRLMDFYDGNYTLYDSSLTREENEEMLGCFNNRSDSYTMFDY